MAKTQAVIGYSPNLRGRRTVVLPDDDSQVPGIVAWLTGLGEGALVVPLADYQSAGPDALLRRHFSLPPVKDRCLVVNAFGVAVAAVCADPKLDQHPLGRLVHDPAGKVGVGGSTLGVPLP